MYKVSSEAHLHLTRVLLCGCIFHGFVSTLFPIRFYAFLFFAGYAKDAEGYLETACLTFCGVNCVMELLGE